MNILARYTLSTVVNGHALGRSPIMIEEPVLVRHEDSPLSGRYHVVLKVRYQ